MIELSKDFRNLYSKCLWIIEKLNAKRYFKESIRTTFLGIKDISDSEVIVSLLLEFGYPVRPNICTLNIPNYAFEEKNGIELLLKNTFK